MFLFIVFFFSCEKGFITNCSDCTETEPVYADIEISIDYQISSSNNTLISIYEGDLEDGILIKEFSANGRDVTYFEVQINKKYTVKATYNIGTRTYIAIDSVIPKVRYETNDCDQPCYFVYNKSIDLRLKYQ